MKKQYYKESGLKFIFPDHWKVVKLDEHRFYGYVSGRGFKGVDFILEDVNGTSILMEVKNYTNRFPGDGVDPVEAVLENPTAYGEKYTRKFEDSFHLIRVIYQYYQRKFWFRRIVEPLLKKHHFLRGLNLPFIFWWQLYQNIFVRKGKLRLLLWLKLGDQLSKEKEERLKEQLLQIFKQSQERLGVLVEIVDQDFISPL